MNVWIADGSGEMVDRLWEPLLALSNVKLLPERLDKVIIRTCVFPKMRPLRLIHTWLFVLSKQTFEI